jgi:Rps23 Pro-64 3,4-dihydroxylase Tpa1-like proline 4-hydroxylase
VASPLLLDCWATFDPERSTEGGELIERIPARFDQLTVFDSRLPHGVAVVEGTRDPLEARVALHGWFHDPEPRIDGGPD